MSSQVLIKIGTVKSTEGHCTHALMWSYNDHSGAGEDARLVEVVLCTAITHMITAINMTIQFQVYDKDFLCTLENIAVIHTILTIHFSWIIHDHYLMVH